MTQTRQHSENLLMTTRNPTDAERTLRPSSPSQGREDPESERKSSILSTETVQCKTKVVDRDSDRNFGMRTLIHNQRPKRKKVQEKLSSLEATVSQRIIIPGPSEGQKSDPDWT